VFLMIANTFAVALIDQIRLHTLASGAGQGQLLIQQKHMYCSLYEHSVVGRSLQVYYTKSEHTLFALIDQ
jgi:hypothetical protein